MMEVFQKIKRECLGLSAVTMMAGAELLGVWQLIRNILLLLLRVPYAAIGGVSFFIGTLLVLFLFCIGFGSFFEFFTGKRFVKGDLTLKHSLCSHFKISHNLNILIYYNKSIWIEFFYDFSQRMVFSLGHNG